MTVGELMKELEYRDEDMEIVFRPDGSDYVESIKYVSCRDISSFYGKDREAYVISGGEQVGAV